MGEEKEKARISIAVIGDVDSGKSTLAGHLICKLGRVDESLIEEIEKEAFRLLGQCRFQYAWVLDRLKAERENCRTIDTTIAKFETAKYDCTVIDTPGHRDYLKNMITGTSQADCALVVIDSYHFKYDTPTGLIREHLLFAYTLGVKQIICCCNKMDDTTPEYSKSTFDEIEKYMRPCLMGIGFDKVLFVPISGYEGDNLTERSPNLDWYKGPTLLEAIDQIDKPKRLFDKKPLRLPISDVYNIGKLGTVAVGRVETGVMKPGMAVTFGPYGLTTEVKSIERHHKPLLEALPGDIVGFNVKNVAVKDLKRGYVASNSRDNPAMCANSFTSHVILMNLPGQIRKGYAPVLDCHTCHTTVEFDELLSKIDRKTFKVLELKPEFLINGEAGMVKMVPRKPMVVETFDDFPPLGRFVLRDPRQTVGVGVVKSVDKVLMVPKVKEPKGDKEKRSEGEPLQSDISNLASSNIIN